MNISIKTDLFLQLQPNPVAPPPPAPPRLPTYECPICTEPLVEQATATSCGHLFCEDCITAAIHLQTKCPICRRKVTSRQINRIYFPLEASSSMQPTFECPICMGPLVEQMATRCGHIFCEGCIRDVVGFHAEQCPICRRKVVHRELNRIYFPTCN
ncbi:putative transcription factor C2H2 family [Helianthus annuus]|uniref:Putative zinc finger, RING/FYVE/PHD-type n=1 Tax=Helianthus annuus TaxID=4232 RepID=A0A251UZ35_HELAN|nr:putative transcription factor C2H2 family [Helianthus annuus]KAJ0589081.1 putative transcription factor C2H2 family [Helianthus annuus]KAJ0931492.1 putative transcription factor C2H2 family [Helianthus annuus]